MAMAMTKLSCHKYPLKGTSSRLVPSKPLMEAGITEIDVTTARIFSILLASKDVWLMYRSIMERRFSIRSCESSFRYDAPSCSTWKDSSESLSKPWSGTFFESGIL